MTNFNIVSQKQPFYGHFIFCVFLVFLVLKKLKINEKKITKVILDFGNGHS